MAWLGVSPTATPPDLPASLSTAALGDFGSSDAGTAAAADSHTIAGGVGLVLDPPAPAPVYQPIVATGPVVVTPPTPPPVVPIQASDADANAAQGAADAQASAVIASVAAQAAAALNTIQATGDVVVTPPPPAANPVPIQATGDIVITQSVPAPTIPIQASQTSSADAFDADAFFPTGGTTASHATHATESWAADGDTVGASVAAPLELHHADLTADWFFLDGWFDSMGVHKTFADFILY